MSEKEKIVCHDCEGYGFTLDLASCTTCMQSGKIMKSDCKHEYIPANSPHGECDVCVHCEDVI